MFIPSAQDFKVCNNLQIIKCVNRPKNIIFPGEDYDDDEMECTPNETHLKKLPTAVPTSTQVATAFLVSNQVAMEVLSQTEMNTTVLVRSVHQDMPTLRSVHRGTSALRSVHRALHLLYSLQGILSHIRPGSRHSVQLVSICKFVIVMC